MMTVDTYARRASLPATEVEDEVFLVIPDGQEIVHLDRLAAGLWRLLEAPLTLNAVVDTFAAAFPDMPVAQLRADILSALGEMEEQQVIEVTRPGRGGPL
ncbi:MAG: PqqD family protein [Sneathiellaceae bacterium]